jgi:hypothetical protein
MLEQVGMGRQLVVDVAVLEVVVEGLAVLEAGGHVYTDVETVALGELGGGGGGYLLVQPGLLHFGPGQEFWQ